MTSDELPQIPADKWYDQLIEFFKKNAILPFGGPHPTDYWPVLKPTQYAEFLVQQVSFENRFTSENKTILSLIGLNAVNKILKVGKR
jgi:hypothetical protein